MQVAMKSPNLSEFSATMDSQKKQQLISPVIKSHSRGARFLDLVKNNKLNVSPQLTKRLSMHKNDLMERSDKKNIENQYQKEYLKFSNNGTANLTSSPSSGILSKRKNAVIDTPDSPSQNSAKRKRVSFNDPVSTTKEYLITEEEERQKSNSLIRCLTYENDENLEQEDMVCENKENIITVPSNETKMEQDLEEKVVVKVETEELTTNSIVLDHDYDENPQNTDITTSSDDLPEQQTSDEETESSKLVFKDKDDLMDYVTQNFTFNEIFDKLLQSNEDESLRRKELIENILDKVDVLNEFLPLQDPKQTKMSTEQLEKTSNLINHLSKVMKMNDRIKHKVLDTLSEKHSKDFLTHALQENSVTTVCQKITVPSIINYLIHKVNVCDEDDEIDFEINRMNRNIMHHLIKKTGKTREIISDQKEVQELLKLLFQNMQKIEVLDTVHEFLRSNIIQGPF